MLYQLPTQHKAQKMKKNSIRADIIYQSQQKAFTSVYL